MSNLIKVATAGLVLSGYGIANASKTANYALVGDSLIFVFSAACLVLALLIFLSLRGGSLGIPWLFFFIGFALAGAGGAMQVLDMLKIAVNQYDLRPSLLITRAGSMLFFLVGLFLYKRGLQ